MDETDNLSDFTIADPPSSAAVTVTPTSLALTELGTSSTIEKTYTLVLATDPGADVTVTVTNGDATAVAVDTDAGTSGNQNTLTFTHGNSGNWGTAQTVTVRALNDGDATSEPSFTLTHVATAASGPYNGITIDPVAISITDAGHGVVVSESSVSVAENDETVTYTVVLKSQPSGNVVISATSGATTTATVSPPTLTFTTSDWNTPQTVTITGKGAGSTSISHAVQSSADTTNYPTTTTTPSVSVTVTAVAEVSLPYITPTEFYEGETVTFKIVLSPEQAMRWNDNPDYRQLVGFEGTAEVDTDFENQSAGTFFQQSAIQEGDNYTLSLTLRSLTDNDDTEGDETIIVILEAGYVGDTSDYYEYERVTITLKDGARPAAADRVIVSPTSLALTELGSPADVTKTYTLVLSSDPVADVTITLSNIDIDAFEVDTDSTMSGDQRTLTFTAGGDGSGSGTGNGNWAVAQTVTVRALNDRDVVNEDINIIHSASAASGPYNGITIDPVVLTITDAGHGVVVSESSVSVAENDATVTYTVALKSQPSGNVVISATSGATATATVSPPTLTFTNSDWNTPQTVTITGKGAGSTSISHAVTTSADTTNYPTSTTIPSVSVTVSAATGITLTETSGSTVVSEDGSTTTDSYDLVLRSAPTHDVTVTVSAGSGVQVNKAGGSYASSQTLTFTPSGTGLWSTAQTITVRGVDDSVDNPGGSRTVTISHTASSADPAYNNPSVDSVEVRVTDDDATTVTLAGASVNINEGQTKTFTVTLGRGLVDGEVLTVPLTFGGTATRGTDYTMTGTTATGVQYNNLDSGSATVVFTGPQTATTATTATITLSATTDSTVESTAETVIIGLGTITNTGLTGAGGVSPTDNLSDFTISDPPSTANVTVSPTSLALTELGTSSTIEKTYTIVLDTDPGADVFLTVTNGDATAVAVDTDAGTSGDQFILSFTHGNTGNWGTAQTVTVRALNDGDGDNESFNLTHTATAASGPYNGITINPVAITTTDAGYGVVVSKSSVSVDDNDDTATYTVTLKSQPSGNVVISATSGNTSNATASPGTLTFTSSNWKTPQTVTITGKGAGSTTISHAVTSATGDQTNYPTSTTIPSVSVSVSSTTTPGVTLTETGGSTVVSEDSSTTPDSYDIVLDSRPTHDVTLTVSAGSGVEVSKDGGTSYATSQTLTFTPSGTGIWSTAQTITVRGIDDSVDNPGGGRDVTISHATSSTDPAYSNLSVDSVDVRVTDVIVAGVDVSKETVSIREGRTDRYTIVLKSTPQTNVVISITSQDPDIAEVVPKMLTFTPQNARTPQTVTVRGVDDNLDNGSPRITDIDHDVLTTNDPDYRGFFINSITVTVADKAKLEEAALSTSAGLIRFGRTVGQQVVGAVRDREGADRTRGFVSSLAGENLPRIAGPRDASDLPDQEYGLATRHHRSDNDRYQVDGFGQDENEDLTRSLSEEDFLRGTSFTLNTMKDDGTSLAFWGRGSVSEFRGTTEGIFLDGEVRDVMVGTDRIKNARLMGIMVMGSRGDITYRSGGDNGRLETSLTSLVPYGSLDLRNGLSFWGAVGVGWGTLTLTPEGTDPVDGTIDWHMAAGGIEGSLAGVDMLPGARLGWHTDALWTRTGSEPIDDLPELGGKTTRLRLGVEATWPEKPALNGLVSPHAGLGLRYDGGDAETGFGLEISSGLTWRDPESNLSILVEGRTLAVHEDGDFRDWGLTFGLFWDPRPDTKEGFSARFGYELGHGTSGENALLGPETYPVQREADGSTSWRSEVAFGVSQGGGMVGSPYGGIAGTSDDVDEARVGYRIEPDTPNAEKLSIDVWTDPVAGDEDTSTGAGLMWRW